ncbi:hypothetical protein BGW36DRAFT_426974 [Talaromyces proteolyticus]|uniref:Uncharacterized protein n=1 Tax=Talaromyces proteolyticus TaxID=1131652 RepID=A0AAD4Q271_9EURO|nr:uncharacterized protein BGW36DRAFT_426974 [Talaromyces proteolyticus]KAH8699313.1 hypothetical protein BGW36DRAFT_426974 [Talaromyces proteolyticus]
MSSPYNELNGDSLYATNDNKTDTEGVLVTGAAPGIFFFDNSTGHLATVSDISSETRFGYTLYSNYTGSVRFDVLENHNTTTVYYPKFAFVQNDGGWFVPLANLSFIWCQEGSHVDDPLYMPGSVALSLTRVVDDCYTISSLTGVDPSSL